MESDEGLFDLYDTDLYEATDERLLLLSA